MHNAHPADKYSRRQRQKQLPTIVNLGAEGQVEAGLHSSDIHRRIQRVKPRSVKLIELLIVDPSEKLDRVVHETRHVTCVLVQKGK